MSFQQYAHKLQNWNTQCQFLAGVHKLPKADRGRHLLETAKEHMATFELVSFIDHIQEFAHALGLKGEVPRTNRREEALFEPTAEDLARARAVNELDQELYDWARARYLPAKADALKA